MNTSKKRYAWVDLLKAFLIFTIVTEHMAPYVFHSLPNVYINLITSFNLAAFFFLSGMFVSTENNPLKQLKSIVSLLIPFLVIGSIWTLYFKKASWESLIYGHYHNGFWFILTLLMLRLCFIIRNSLAGKLRDMRHGFLTADFIIIAIVMFAGIFSKTLLSPEIRHALSLDVVHHNVIYYFMGFWYKKHILAKGRIVPKIVTECASILFFTAFIAQSASSSILIQSGLHMVCAICGTLVIVQLFQTFPEKFRGSDWIQFVGRHTLEIYVGHYFFIPVGISTLFLPIAMAGNGVAIILYSLIAVTIIAIMSIILYVLDKSTILTFMLFGRIKS